MRKIPLKDHRIYDVLESTLEEKSKLDISLDNGVCKIFLRKRNGGLIPRIFSRLRPCVELRLLTEYENKTFFFSKKKGVVGFTDKSNRKREKSFDARAAIDRSDALLHILNNHINDD